MGVVEVEDEESFFGPLGSLLADIAIDYVKDAAIGAAITAAVTVTAPALGTVAVAIGTVAVVAKAVRVGARVYKAATNATRRTVGYHAAHPDVAPLIQQNGFRAGTGPGRLGSGGTYVNNTRQGAVAEFQHHNPGATPTVLKVEYSPGVNASTSVAPRNYVDNLPFNNVDSISAPSVRLAGTTNTNVMNGSVRIVE